MSSTLWKYNNYNAPMHYIFDKQIIEMDIRKANISILFDAGKISASTYNWLLQADRSTRQVQVGYMIRDDHSLQEVLDEGLAMARKRLFETLKLENSNILHIAKDAVFIIVPMVLHVPDSIQISDHIVFTNRGSYSNYLRLNRLIHFYHSYNVIQDCSIWNIRGMGEASEALHKDGFIKILCDILKTRQLNGAKAAYDLCRTYWTMMSNNQLDVSTKRRFDSQSMYDLSVPEAMFAPFQADYLSESAVDYVNPQYNLSLLQDIANYLLCDAMSSI